MTNVSRRLRLSPLVRGSAIAMGSRGAGVLLSLATSVIIARYWGPEGKGVISFLNAASVLVVRAGSFGAEASIGYLLLVRRYPPGTTLGSVFGATVGIGIVASILATMAAMTHPSWLNSVPVTVAIIQCAALPAAFVLFVSTYVFFAFGKDAFFGIFDLSFRLATLAAVFAAAAVGGGVRAAVAAQAVVSGAFALVALAGAARWSGPWRITRQVVRDMASQGGRYYVYSVARYVMSYGSVIVAALMIGVRDAGVLSIALMMGESVWLASGSINLAFYRSVVVAEEPYQHTRLVMARMLWLCLGLATVGTLIGYATVPVVFGLAFSDAPMLFLLLVPGVVGLSVEQVLSSYYAASGMPWRVVGIVGVASAASVAAMIAGASIGGAAGLAIAASGVQLIAALAVYREFIRNSRRNAMIVSAAVPGPSASLLT